MIIYLAGDVYGKEIFPEVNHAFNRLDTFWDVYNDRHAVKNVNLYNRYILDSGAFTFMMAAKAGKKIKVDIDHFTEAYIEFILKHNIKHFFEMDVDSVLGYEKVKQLRSRIEAKTGRQSIPVFHKNRGLADWTAMVKDYSYVAIGIAGKDTGWGDFATFKKFVLSAKEHSCKVHGLGITGMRSMASVPFYSVDSSAWTAGNRYKGIVKFDGNKIVNIKGLENKRVHDHKALARHNLGEWIKFANHMENRIIL